MTDILLTHSYHLYYDSKQVKKMQPYPPLGTLYAAGLLRQYGYSVALFDTMLNDPKAGFREALQRHQPEVVIVYEDNFNFLSKMCLTRMRQVAFEMSEAARSAGVLILANGSDASDHVAEYLHAGFAGVLLGEAEWTLLEAMRSLNGSGEQALSQITGLAYLDRSGRIVRTARRPLMRDLDQLPLPARDLIDVSSYRQAWQSSHGFLSLNLISSRGCPYRCNWCAKPIYGDSFALRAPHCVAEEMRILKHELGAEHLWFADDIFGLKPKWVLEFAEEVEKRDAALPFKMQSRVDLISPAAADALRRAGCAEVWMGAESGSQAILNAMDKGTCVEQIFSARENLRRQGIKACYFLQFGYPGEDWEAIKSTVKLVRSTRPDDVGVSVSYPLPGTKFYERVREQLGAKTNWADSGDVSMMFQGPYNNEFYRALHDYLHAEVDSWSPQASSTKRDVKDEAAARWRRIVQMEVSCRNPNATQPRRFHGEHLVRLQPAGGLGAD